MKKYIKDLLINFIASSFLIPRKLRCLIYKAYGISIKTKRINPGCIFNTNKVSIGNNSFINFRCIFDNEEMIEIGDRCHIAQEVIFAGISHIKGNSNRRAGDEFSLPIKIGNGCWIGARSTILPGITIGNGIIIAAGSVITKDCEQNSLYAGIPAKKIKQLSD